MAESEESYDRLKEFAFNPRGRRVYEKAEFLIESVDKDALEYDSMWIDSINMILKRERWESIRNVQ